MVSLKSTAIQAEDLLAASALVFPDFFSVSSREFEGEVVLF